MGLGGRALSKPPSSVTPKSSRQSGAVRRPLSVGRNAVPCRKIVDPIALVLGGGPSVRRAAHLLVVSHLRYSLGYGEVANGDQDAGNVR
jgi:hypothetical protein